MHHRRANAQFGQVPVTVVVHLGGLLAPPALQYPLAKQGSFGNQRQVLLRQHHALFHGGNGNGQGGVGFLQKLLPASDGGQFQFVVTQVFDQCFPPAGGFGTDQYPAGKLPDEPFQSSGRIRRPSVHGHIRQGFGIAVGAAGTFNRFRSTGDPRVGFELAKHLVLLQEQLRGRQDRPQAVMAAVFVPGPGFGIKRRNGIVQAVGREHQGRSRQVI